MKYAVASLFAILISLSSFSQKGKDYFLLDSVGYDSLSLSDKALLDSILPLYHKAKNDTTRFRLLNGLVEGLNAEKLWPRYNILVHGMTEAALKDQSAFSKEEEYATKKYYASSLQSLGLYQENVAADLAKAMDYYNECKKIQEAVGDKHGLGLTLNNMAIVFEHQGNIPKALEYFLQALKIVESIHDKQAIAYAVNNIGGLYFMQGDTASALKYHIRGLKIREEIGDKQGEIYSLSNLGAVYDGKGDFTKALYYYFKCYKISQENGQKLGMAYSYQHIGAIYQRLWDKDGKEQKKLSDTLFSKSLEYLNISLQMFIELSDKQGIAFDLFSIGNLYFKSNDLTKATSFASQSLEMATAIGFPLFIRNSSELLYEIYKQQGKFEQALRMHELTILMRDSILNDETKKSTFKQQTKYEYEKQEALKNVEHQKELAIAEEGKKRQQIVSYSIGFGLFMLALFSMFIFNRLQITRKQKGIIEDQKKIVDAKNKHITDSINYAKRIQDSILPSKEELSKCFSDYFIFFQPRDIVSGDFYWLSGQNGKTILAVADCTGHGVPGAFMSMIGNTLLNEIVNEQKINQPAEILNHLNEGIVNALHQESRTQDDGMDISVCLFEGNKVTFAGANHTLYIVKEKSVSKITGDEFSIGGVFGKKDVSFSQKEILLEKNTNIFLCSDGFADLRGGASGKRFSGKRVEELFAELSSMDGNERSKCIREKFNSWSGSYPQIDDVLVAGIKI
jgi:serine phosphatase RsbU (regulator of sigma subunit)